ncbi:sulfotransferase [Flavitalea flava]
MDKSPLPLNWIPYKLESLKDRTLQCHWLPAGNLGFTDPFFDETILKAKFLHAGHKQKSVSDCPILSEWAGDMETVAPSAFIFHVSRCGSTLVSQMLTQLKSAIVLAEVPFFDDILRLPPEVQEANGWPVLSLLSAAIRLYGRKRTGKEKYLFVKTDSWHLFYYDLLRKLYPDTPFILLFRTPAEVIRSHEKRRGIQAVPGMIDPALFGLEPHNFGESDLNTYMANVLEKYYEQLMTIAQADKNILLVNYKEGPESLTNKIVSFCGIPVGESEKADMEKRSLFHAKMATSVFSEEKVDEKGPVYQKAALERYYQVEELWEVLERERSEGRSKESV